MALYAFLVFEKLYLLFFKFGYSSIVVSLFETVNVINIRLLSSPRINSCELYDHFLINVLLSSSEPEGKDGFTYSNYHSWRKAL